MQLEDIGFYTLSDERAWNTTHKTPLERCEIILTDRCNFRCPYCRGMRKGLRGDMDSDTAWNVVNGWISEGLKNIRFSGGEPTLYKLLPDLVERCAEGGIERIAVSTNGSADLDLYKKLIQLGMNDISISLDGCCAQVGDLMSGGMSGSWNKVVSNIKALSQLSYITLGLVFTEDNINDCQKIVKFASSLGTADMRVIPSAQYNKSLALLGELGSDFLEQYPILNYRVKNVRAGRHVRGIGKNDCHTCWLALDDMAVAKEFHFPCIIHMREGGDPIGKTSDMAQVRRDRLDWVLSHNTMKDPICRANCLDVCIDYNNKAAETHSVKNGKMILNMAGLV